MASYIGYLNLFLAVLQSQNFLCPCNEWIVRFQYEYSNTSFKVFITRNKLNFERVKIMLSNDLPVSSSANNSNFFILFHFVYDNSMQIESFLIASGFRSFKRLNDLNNFIGIPLVFTICKIHYQWHPHQFQGEYIENAYNRADAL